MLSQLQNLKYHTTNPANVKDVYGEFDTLSFKLSGVGRKLVGNSLRLGFDVSITNNEDNNVICAYDPYVGGHAFVDTINTSFSNVGQIENVRYYQRMVAVKARASHAKEDFFNSDKVAQGQVCDATIADKLLKGYVPFSFNNAAFDADATTTLDLCIKPDFCLNQVLGPDMNIPFKKIGDIEITITLPRSVSCLFGNAEIGGDMRYELRNVKMYYQTVIDDNKESKQYTMRIKSDLKQSLNSQYCNVSSKVPIVADSFFASFIRADRENLPPLNSMVCERPPNISRLQFLWDDSASQQITFELINQVDYLNNFIKAINKTTDCDNDASIVMTAANDCWGLGLAFGQFINLANTKLSLNIASDVSSALPYTMYLHFSGILSV